MAERHTAFVGSIPGNYDRYLGPLFFHGYADDLVARLRVSRGMRVLETACGTGIVTERFVACTAGHRDTIVATDLNEPMIEHARQKLGSASRLEWRQADATKLPFDDNSFDAVVCQFGLMFFPDKEAGIREAFRMLRPGGQYLLSVWDALDRNPVPRITHETVASFFASDAPQFYTIPFSLHDVTQVRTWLSAAGFTDVESHPVAMTGVSPSAAEAARGLIEGNPICIAIMERRPDTLADIETAVARNVAAQLGDHPLRAPLRAFVFSTRK